MNSYPPIKLVCEFLNNPLGLDETKPRLSWKLSDSRPGALQKAYQIQAAASAEALESGPLLWDTQKVECDAQLDIEWAGAPLSSRQEVYWRVRVWDADSVESPWSEVAHFELGLLSENDWKAQWVGRAPSNKETSQPAPYLRKPFSLPNKVIKKARLYTACKGVFEAHINGQKVSADWFAPGWSSYTHRHFTVTYDVTSLVKSGDNLIGAILGDGWYAGYLCWEKTHFIWGDTLALLAQLEVTFEDGSTQIIVTDNSWKTTTGPIVVSDIYNGETYDARLELGNWDTAEYLESAAWVNVDIQEKPVAVLSAHKGPPVRAIETLKPRAVTEPQPGVYVYDLGQNMVGIARFKIKGKSGQTVKFRYAEMLNDDGTMYVTNLRSAKATDYYTFAKDGEVVWQPTFTFHGFRFVEITGVDGNPGLDAVEGYVLHSDCPDTGHFTSSNPLLNRLQSNIRWGQKGNFLDVPTDCPQRDERLGWTGDAQIFARTACFNLNVSAFFENWLRTLADDQFDGGAFPHVSPDPFGKMFAANGWYNGAAAAWADAGVIIPLVHYYCYGGKRVLERQYDSMVNWVEYCRRNSKNLIPNRWTFGDWLAVECFNNDPGKSATPWQLVATGYFAHSSNLLSQVAKILGKNDDAEKYAALYRDVCKAFNHEFVTPSGRIVGHTQTAYLMALGFDLIPEELKPAALNHLVSDIEGRGYHLSTGFVGTPLLCPVLTRYGRIDVAYKLLMQESYPAWFYPILQGDATTMWERWNSYTKDKGFGDAGMNSFNHYAYGAVGEWLYNTVAGLDIDPEKPGYKHIRFHPQPGGGLTHAKAALDTRYGLASIEWRIEGGSLSVSCVVPPNTTATLQLPDGSQPTALKAGHFETQIPWAPEEPIKKE